MSFIEILRKVFLHHVLLHLINPNSQFSKSGYILQFPKPNKQSYYFMYCTALPPYFDPKRRKGESSFFGAYLI